MQLTRIDLLIRRYPTSLFDKTKNTPIGIDLDALIAAMQKSSTSTSRLSGERPRGW